MLVISKRINFIGFTNEFAAEFDMPVEEKRREPNKKALCYCMLFCVTNFQKFPHGIPRSMHFKVNEDINLP